MSLVCLLGGCRREAATCRCVRCGRAMHDWQRVGKCEVWAELRGRTREGKMRYDKTSLLRDRCASCGLERKETRTEKVDH